MAIQTEAKRVKTGQSLTDMENQAIGAISQLEGIKTNLLNLKASVKTDTDFDATDEAEVQAVIAGLVTKIQALIG